MSIGHCIRVWLASRSLTGLMHDSVEDGWWPRALAWPTLEAVSRRESETYHCYILRVRENPKAVRVKLADLVDNLTRGGGPHESLRHRYRKALMTLTECEPKEVR
jgi:hypothetical protein